MSREKRLGMVALIAGGVVLLASCGGSETARNAASAESQAAAEGYASRAPGEQAQTEGPATASVKATTMCIENLSSVTPVVTFSLYNKQSGEGALKFRASACATGSFGEFDVKGRIALPMLNAPMEFWAVNPSIGFPSAGLNQQGVGRCLSSKYSEGERRTWDDGLLQYVIERKPDGGEKTFRMTIRDSAKPSADGNPDKCTPSNPTVVVIV